MEKGWALNRAMLLELTRKRYYLKLDLDCVLRPPRLLAFLDFLHRRVAPDSLLHFGTTTLGAGGGKKTTTYPHRGSTFGLAACRRAPCSLRSLLLALTSTLLEPLCEKVGL